MACGGEKETYVMAILLGPGSLSDQGFWDQRLALRQRAQDFRMYSFGNTLQEFGFV